MTIRCDNMFHVKVGHLNGRDIVMPVTIQIPEAHLSVFEDKKLFPELIQTIRHALPKLVASPEVEPGTAELQTFFGLTAAPSSFYNHFHLLDKRFLLHYQFRPLATTYHLLVLCQ